MAKTASLTGGRFPLVVDRGGLPGCVPKGRRAVRKERSAVSVSIDRMVRSARSVLRRPFVWRAHRRDAGYSGSAPHGLAICAIFREEAPFLAEWIEFHRGVGATQFYLYNNFSTDAFREVLAPYIRDGIVTLTDWPVEVGQVPAYRDCMRRFWRDARWIALIDIDEFLFSPGTIDIVPILDRYRHVPGIHVWQHFFGSSGHMVPPDGPLLDAYRMRARIETITTAKSIVNPRAVYRPDVHLSKYWWGESVDTNGAPVDDAASKPMDLLRINHYWSRSIRALETKIARGDASTAIPRAPGWHFAFERTLNEVEDDAILPVAKAIREGRGTNSGRR